MILASDLSQNFTKDVDCIFGQLKAETVKGFVFKVAHSHDWKSNAGFC